MCFFRKEEFHKALKKQEELGQAESYPVAAVGGTHSTGMIKKPEAGTPTRGTEEEAMPWH